MKANYHTHTYRCHHATMDPDEAYILAAIEAGFDELAMTDHVPFKETKYPLQFQDRMSYEECDDYLSSIRELKEKYRDKIHILVGFEAEYFPEQEDYLRKLSEKADILINGQHFRDCCCNDYATISQTSEDLLHLGEQYEQAARSGLFSIIAHPDYFMLGRNCWNTDCERLAHKVAELSVTYDIPLEINLGGLKYGLRDYGDKRAYAYPFYEFWEIVSQYPVKAIYGYDAHDPKVLKENWRMDEVNRVLKGLPLHIIDHIEVEEKKYE